MLKVLRYGRPVPSLSRKRSQACSDVPSEQQLLRAMWATGFPGAIAFLMLLLLAGCNRDTSSPSKTLIGHWVATSRVRGEQTDYCFRKDGQVVWRDRARDTIKKKPYTVESESPTNHTVEVAIDRQREAGYANRIVFTPDGMRAKLFSGGSIGETIDRARETIQQSYQQMGQNAPILPDLTLEDWQYVDDNVEGCD